MWHSDSPLAAAIGLVNAPAMPGPCSCNAGMDQVGLQQNTPLGKVILCESGGWYSAGRSPPMINAVQLSRPVRCSVCSRRVSASPNFSPPACLLEQGALWRR